MGFKTDLDDQMVSFSVLTLGLVIWPVKIVPEMTYNVSSVTSNPTHSPLLLWRHCTIILCTVYTASTPDMVRTWPNVVPNISHPLPSSSCSAASN